MENSLVSRLVCRLVGWLVSRLVRWFVCGLVGRLVGGLVSGLVGSWPVGGLVVGRGRGVLFVVVGSGRLVVVVLGLAGVGHFRDVAGVAVDVVLDVLDAAVGEEDVVLAVGAVSVARLGVPEVVVVVILHGIVEAILGMLLKYAKKGPNFRYIIDSFLSIV